MIFNLVCKQCLADQKLLNPENTFNAILLGSENPQCKIPEVQKNAATFMLLMNLITGFLSAIVTPKLGHLSDRCAGSILDQSYISDCTPPSKCAAAIRYTHACLFTGLAFGPPLPGYFVKWTGSFLSIFYGVLGFHSMFVIIIGLIIPESLSKKKQLLAREKWDKS
ncbi:hypothetical protein FOQG_12786 [Fusarium oxysporum f. sp. raphani 54005]|uniref:Major facilitator superfamily (MFS) profile domain-containing protein n=1 Tax=Fusarium oxysporum f. sp. raphani 54005 TaxID=1089458 RepID=X0BWS2_FUSOX|nr:hypothetical protein FOQG_12786 [Fusarium oxysporum f. sp. raphani 54005]KAJ4029028.1 hypothetical protein NW753_014402 [Fusarium oxysporum]KAJ4051390.1 hypothetical protein NW758_003733 [Fusarium oxysporum]KAJ4072790.1 hypothetical protein NW761_014618 [Fusarium oxysporum]KAJ4111286.1 hypothetical protein NW769_007463 [Fusarium oxysporum]